MTRIAIISQKTLLVDSLSLMLNIEKQLEVSFTTHDYNALLQKTSQVNFEVVIFMDSLENPGSLKAISDFCVRHKKTKVLIISDNENHSLIRESYLVGSSGYVSTSESRLELIKAIDTVAKGEQFFGKVAINALVARDIYAVQDEHQITQLTSREKEIVLLILEEKSSGEIATLLHISQGTVESHRHNIKKKLKVRSSIGVVKYALRIGLTA